LQKRADGGPCEDRSDSKLGSAKKGEIVACYYGTYRYCRKFIKGYAQITEPMEKLLKKAIVFCWNDHCKKILDIMKEKMVIMPILVFLN